MEKLLHALHALLVLDLGEGVFHGVFRAVIGEVHLGRDVALFIDVKEMPLLGRAVEDDLLLLRCEIPEGNVRAHTHVPGDVLHQGPHQALPRSDGTFVDGQGLVRHQAALVHRSHDPGPAAGGAGPVRVEGHGLGPGAVELLTADRALCRQHQGHIHIRRAGMPVGAAVASEAREHQAQAVQKLRRRAEGAAHPGDSRPLVQGQRRRNIAYLFHFRPACLGNAAAGIGGQRLQIPARALRIERPQRQGGLARARDARDRDKLSQRDVHVDVLQIMYLCAPDFDGRGRRFLFRHVFSLSSVLRTHRFTGPSLPDCESVPILYHSSALFPSTQFSGTWYGS